MVKVTQLAPDFTAEALVGDKVQKIQLSKYKGKWVVLFFYPADFTFICPTEITEFSKRTPEFTKLNAVVIGASTDSTHSHKAWMKELGGVKYPLIGDMNHKLSAEYGVLLEEKGTAMRGTFIIDPEGILRYQLIHDDSVGRSVTETLRVLMGFQTGELCPVEWAPGKKTLGKA